MYVGGVLELKKFDIRGLNSRFDVKKANLRGIVAKIGYLGLFWLLEPTFGPFTWVTPWELCPKVCWRGSRGQEISWIRQEELCTKVYFRSSKAKKFRF